MLTIEGKQERVWIDAYVKKTGKLEGVTMAVRVSVKKTLTGGRGVRESVEDSVV